MLWLSTMAFAQEVPTLNAQLFRPAMDAQYTLRTDDTHLGTEGELQGRAMLQYVNDPLVYTRSDGERTDLVSDITQLDVMGLYNFGDFRVGLDVPIYLRTAGDLTQGETGLGDIGLDVKSRFVEGPLGLGASGRLFLPTSTVEAPLGDGKIAGEIAGIVDGHVGPIALAFNLGARILPSSDLENTGWDDSLVARLGGGYALSDDGGISLDLAQQAPFAELGNGKAFPVEALAGGWGRVDGPWVARGGIGTGLSEGVGAPRARVLLALSYEPEPERDTDGDGLVDLEDDCPTRAEDIDGYLDEDGCPEPTTVHVQFVDPEGSIIPEVAYRFTGATDANGSYGDAIIQLNSGLYVLDATSEGFAPLQQASIIIPDGPPTELRQQLSVDLDHGRLVIHIVDPDGNDLDASVSVDEEEAVLAQGGNVTLDLAPGSHLLTVTSPGYLQDSRMFSLDPEETRELEIALKPGKVEIQKDRISLPESIYFGTNTDVIQSRSYGLLKEVALLLVETPGIQRLRIEGHTDVRGSIAYNQRLSERRAASVRAFLISEGVAAERVVAFGLGETQPIDPRNTPEAWAKNRRVDMIIETRE